MKITRKRLMATAPAILCLAAAGFAAWAISCPQFGHGRFDVVYSEKTLGPKDVGFFAPSLATSQDLMHLAYVAQRGGNRVVVRDGVVGPEYDVVESDEEPSALQMDSTGRHVVYSARRGEKWFVVVDGVEQGVFDCVRLFRLSPDGSHVCSCVVRDGQDTIRIQSLDNDARDVVETPVQGTVADCRWSPKGNRLACVIVRGGQSWVRVDGQEFGPYLLEMSFEWSPDGGRWLVLLGKTGFEQRLIVNGVEVRDAVADEPVVWSADGKRFAYVARREKGKAYVVDGIAGKPYDRVADGAFSPDGRRFAYAAYTAQAPLGASVVVDNHEGAPYLDVKSPCFGYDGHFAFVAAEGNKRFVVTDGIAGKAYYTIEGLAFASDGSTVRYEADYQVFVLGSLEGRPHEDIRFEHESWMLSDLEVSPDCRHMAYMTAVISPLERLQTAINSWMLRPILSSTYTARSRVVLDRSSGPPCDYASSVVFSGDSRHAAYVAQCHGRLCLVVDGHRNRDIDGDYILAARIIGDSLRLIMSRKGQHILIDIRLKSI